MSVIATALRHMLDAGMDHDAIVSAVAAMEAVAAVDESAERRRAKDRERKQNVRRNPRNSADSADKADTPKSVSPTPPSKITPIPPLKGGTFPTETPLEKPKPLSVWVAEIWELTPRPGRERSGRRDLENALRAALRRGADPAAVRSGVAGYYASPDATKDHGQFAKGVHVVISSGRWEAFAESEPVGQPPDDDPWPRRIREFERNGFWNTTDWGPKPGRPDCKAPQSLLERAA